MDEELELDGDPEPGAEEIPADVVTMSQKSEASIQQRNFARRSEPSINHLNVLHEKTCLSKEIYLLFGNLSFLDVIEPLASHYIFQTYILPISLQYLQDSGLFINIHRFLSPPFSAPFILP